MKHFQRQFTFVLMIVMLFLVVACGRQQNTGGGGIVPGLDLLGKIDSARVHYNQGVTQEGTLTTLWQAYEQNMNEFRTGAGDLMAINNGCFANVAATEAAIAKAAVGDMSDSALINALTTTSITGEVATTECVQLSRQLADFVITHRAAVKNSYMMVQDAAKNYLAHSLDQIEVDVMNDVLQTYGDTAGAYAFLKEHGIDGVTDWGWLPTVALRVSHSDEAVCNYYKSGAFKDNLLPGVQTKFSGHEESLMRVYQVAWNPTTFGGRGECRMYGYAALEWMTRPIISNDTRDVLETGEDSGLFPTQP